LSKYANQAAPGLIVENVGIAGLAGSAGSVVAVRLTYSVTSPLFAMALMVSIQSSQSADSLRTTLVFMVVEEAIVRINQALQGYKGVASQQKYKGIDRISCISHEVVSAASYRLSIVM
jgi:hypothetical protein